MKRIGLIDVDGGKTFMDKLNDRYVCYTAKVTTPSGRNGWVEFEIWKEEIE